MDLMKTSRLLVPLLVLALAAAAHAVPNPDIPPTPTGYPIYTAAPAGGSWNAGSTWTSGTVPVPNSVVLIPANVTVTIDHIQNDPASSPKWVRVDGRLSVSTAVSTRFYVETLYITETGTFTIGGEAAPLPLGRTAEIIFTTTGPIDTSWDAEQMSRGLIAEGPVRIFGIQRTHAIAVTSDVAKGTQAMTLETAPLNWQPDDEIVLAGTYFRRAHEFQDELRQIGSLSGTSLTANAPYQYNHLHVTSGAMRPNFHVANLTRNVIFRSQSTEHWYDRGHIILMNRDSQFYRAALIDLGRTDKRAPLDDFIVDGTGTHKQMNPALVINHRGRYALHVHKAGWTTPSSQPPIRVDGCVVKRTFGWAFVNHGSYVDIRRNVAYDFTGAGFVAEDGNEIGNFINNIAIRGHGDGEYLKTRINFGHPTRKQPLADFGFTGDGFWFNGPALTVNGAIANSCNGRGMVWHTTGAVDPKKADATYPYGRYTSFPTDQIVNVYGPAATTLQPRVWNGNANEANISDLPILLSTNIQSYGNFIGFHLRFNNHDNVAWYTEDPFNFDEQITPAPGQVGHQAVPTRLTETISNLTLWNDEEAIAIRYAANALWNGVTAINQLDYDETQAVNPSIHPVHGTEEMFKLDNMTFNGLTIDGWDIANFLELLSTNPNNGATVSDKGTNIVVNTPVYKNFAITGTWDKTTAAIPCPLPTLNTISPPSGATSVLLSWQIAPSLVVDKYLIRYRLVDATEGQFWTYRESKENVIAVPTLPGKSYTWQVMTGCTKTLSNWTAPGPFGT
jgi:G8 domain-containing protein